MIDLSEAVMNLKLTIPFIDALDKIILIYRTETCKETELTA